MVAVRILLPILLKTPGVFCTMNLGVSFWEATVSFIESLILVRGEAISLGVQIDFFVIRNKSTP